MKNRQNVYYREEQKFKQVWLWVGVIFISGIFWYGMYQQIYLGIPFGDKPASDGALIAVWIVFGLLFPLFFYSLRLVTEVRSDGIYIRFFPFHLRFRSFNFDDLKDSDGVTYHAIVRFGGWGIRFGTDGEIAYNVSGDKGIKLSLNNETVIIGTKNQMEFMRAIEEARVDDQR